MQVSKVLNGAAADRSISDDDLCAGCVRCTYRPGELSSCDAGWPGQVGAHEYITECSTFAASDPTTASAAAEIQVLEFGMAPQAKAMGFGPISVLFYGTAAAAKEKFKGRDAILVTGAAVFGKPGEFEFAVMDRVTHEQGASKGETC